MLARLFRAPQPGPARFAPRHRFAPAGLTLALLLGACSINSYPSLGRRPAESNAPAARPATSAAPVTDAALARQLASITASASAADARFARALPEAQRLSEAASGHAPGDPAWGSANDALAVLDGQHAATNVAMADIDEINTSDRVTHALEDSQTGNPALRPDGAAIAAARAAVAAMLARQEAALAQLGARLRP